MAAATAVGNPVLPAAERDWSRTLHLFLNCRLRASRHVAGGAGGIAVPSMPANTQFLIDGVVLAIDDHPALASASWAAVVDHLRACAGRYERLRAQLLDVQAALRYGRDRVQWAAYATVQDMYVAWCVVDGVLKLTRLADMRQAAEAEWPRLVATHLALLWQPAAAAESAPVDSAGKGSSNVGGTTPLLETAVLQFRPLLLDLVRSWVVAGRGGPGALRPDTRRRMEDHVRQALRVQLEACSSSAAAPFGSDHFHLQGQAIAQLLQQQQTSSATAASGGSSSSAAIRARKLLDMTVMQLSDSNRQPFGCRHCGAHFKSTEACSRHYRLHFYARDLADPMVRLRPCTRADFLAHHVSGIPDGSFVRTVAPLSDAYGMDDAAVVVRAAGGAAAASGSGGGVAAAWQAAAGVRKRPRSGLWLVDDPGRAVRCAACGVAFATQMDGSTGEWLLLDAVDALGGTAGVCHSGCVGR